MVGNAVDTLTQWHPDRLPDLAQLWRVAAPDEAIPARELGVVCFEGASDPSIVLGTADGSAAVAAVARVRAGTLVGHVRLLAVHPSGRRRGLGRTLLAAAEGWLRDQGAARVTLGADTPYYLWPGIDATNLAAQAVARQAGYQLVGAAVNLALPIGFRAPTPVGVQVEGVSAACADPVRAFVATHWPIWLPEFELGLARGTAFAAFADPVPGCRAGSRSRDVLGFANHSNLRPGWVGPMGTSPAHRGRGIGAALLAAVCADLGARAAEGAGERPRHVEIAWAGPLGFFADLGARTSRVFLRYSRELDDAPAAGPAGRPSSDTGGSS